MGAVSVRERGGDGASALAFPTTLTRAPWVMYPSQGLGLLSSSTRRVLTRKALACCDEQARWSLSWL